MSIKNVASRLQQGAKKDLSVTGARKNPYLASDVWEPDASQMAVIKKLVAGHNEKEFARVETHLNKVHQQLLAKLRNYPYLDMDELIEALSDKLSSGDALSKSALREAVAYHKEYNVVHGELFRFIRDFYGERINV